MIGIWMSTASHMGVILVTPIKNIAANIMIS